MKVMFDTNVFNHLLTGKIDPNNIPQDWEICTTHVQEDEINKTPDESLKKKLKEIFKAYAPIRTTNRICGLGRFQVE